MTDHDAIAARVRQGRKAGTPGPWKRGKNNPARVSREGRYIADFDPLHSKAQICENDAARAAFLPDLEEAYLDLYDEVQRLRAERDDWMSARNDAVRERMTAEAERDALAHMLDLSKRTTEAVIDRAEKAEAERDRLRAALEWYANPQVYAASKHGIAFDRRDKSYVARAALKGASE